MLLNNNALNFQKMTSDFILYIKLAWRNIWRNRRRTLITMASVVFAVVLAVLLNSVKEGVLFKMQENAVSFYTGAIQIHKKGYWEEKMLDNAFSPNKKDNIQILKLDEVEGITSRLESFALAASEDLTKGCMIVGIDTEKESLITNVESKLTEGQFLTPTDRSILLTSGLAEYLDLQLNDTLVLLGQGYHGINAAAKYPIKGILKLASPELNKQLVYLPLALAQEFFGAENRVTAQILKIKNINYASSVTKDIQQLLPDLEVMDWKILLPQLSQMLKGERVENMIFLGILYLLISFGIFGTILMMLMERQYEFGVLTAIGMLNRNLSVIVVLENIFISLLGSIIGTVLSIPVILYFHLNPIPVTGDLKETYENFGFEPVFYFSIDPWIFYSQTVVVVIIALVLSFYPMLKLWRLEPIEAMRK